MHLSASGLAVQGFRLDWTKRIAIKARMNPIWSFTKILGIIVLGFLLQNSIQANKNVRKRTGRRAGKECYQKEEEFRLAFSFTSNGPIKICLKKMKNTFTSFFAQVVKKMRFFSQHSVLWRIAGMSHRQSMWHRVWRFAVDTDFQYLFFNRIRPDITL